MNRFKILCIVLMLHALGYAQNSIKGKIFDKDSLPLAGAIISIPELNKGISSDKNGFYELINLPNGKLKVRYSFVGYSSIIETVLINGSTEEVNVTMLESSIETDEIVVIAGFSSTQHDNAVKIETLKLNTGDIKSTPNFMEVLTKIPGVDMISKGSGVSKPVIRGLSMNDILVLNNGVRFENYQYSSHHPLGIDEFGIDNVEVIKGPASLLYGSDAIGGVLNFIKEKPAPEGTKMGDYNMQLFSNSLGLTQNFGYKQTGKNIFGGFRIGHKTNSDYLQGGGQFVPNSRFNEYSIKLNLGCNTTNGTFKLFYDYSHQKLGMVEPEAIDSIPERGRKNQLYYQQLATHLLSSQNKLYLGKIKIDLNSAFQNTELIHFADVSTYEIQMRLATLTYETKVYLPSDEHSEYIVGFQGLNQLNRNENNRETILLPNAYINNYSAFGLLQHDFFDKLKLQAGIRYDNKSIRSKSLGLVDSSNYRASIQKKYDSFSGSIGATYTVSESLLFRVNVATAYRTPNLAELTSNGQHETRYELGDNSLIPENSYEYDASMHYHKRNITIDIAGFYNVIDHYIFISPTGDTAKSGIPIYKYMQRNSTLMGGEAGIHYHPVSIKWLHFESTYSSVVGKQSNGDYLPFIPAHKLHFELRIEKEKFAFLHKSYISGTLSSAFKQANVAPDETQTNAYSLFDISFGGTILLKRQSIVMCVGINNVFDKKYIDHLSTLKEVGMYNPGRNITIALKFPFEISKSKIKS